MERRGRTTDIATAQPLDLTYIFRVDGGQRSLIAQADASGRFVVDLPVNVPVKLRAERVGYAGYTFDVPPGSTPLEFQLESVTTELPAVVVERERSKKIPTWAIIGGILLLIVATSDE